MPQDNFENDDRNKTSEGYLSASSLSSYLSDHVDRGKDALEEVLSSGSSLLRQAVAAARNNSASAKDRLEMTYSTGKAHMESTEHVALETLKSGVGYAVQNKEIAATVGIVSTALLLAKSRRFLWRATLGRLQSIEARQQSAAQRTSRLIEHVQSQSTETGRIKEKLSAAQSEHARASAQLRQTASEVETVLKSASYTEKRALHLLEDLREMPASKEVLKLRSDAALAASQIASQRQALEKFVLGLAKQGL